MVRSTRRAGAGQDLVSIPRAINDAQGRGRHHRITGRRHWRDKAELTNAPAGLSDRRLAANFLVAVTVRPGLDTEGDQRRPE